MDTLVQTPENSPQAPPSLTNKPLEKPIERVQKVFNRASWLFLFTLLPLTALILVSQNTVPGDLFYPLKRGLENAVLAGATLHPATRVAFRTDLTERRFEEAEKLLLARKDTTGLNDFVQEVSLAEQEIAALKNEQAKKEVTEKLIKKIGEYQNKLVVIQAQAKESSLIGLPLPTATPTPVKIDKKPTILPSPTPTPIQQKPTTTPVSSSLPTVVKQPSPPTQSTLTPTPTDVLLPSPTPTPTPVPTPVEESEIAKAIDDTQKKLEEIKKQLGKQPGKRVEREDNNGRSSEVRQNEDSRGYEDKDDEEKDKEKDKDKKDKGRRL